MCVVVFFLLLIFIYSIRESTETRQLILLG